ncbi:MAG: thioredoxin family protein [Rhodopirellula sp.]|nr:thioredoxin family protein [Rhodopirellula sp.]
MSGLTSLVVALAAMGGTPDGVLLDFSATWCGPSWSMMPVVHRLQQQGNVIRTVDLDQKRALAQRFRITHMPSFVLVVSGKEQQRFTGSLRNASEITSRNHQKNLATEVRGHEGNSPVKLGVSVVKSWKLF